MAKKILTGLFIIYHITLFAQKDRIDGYIILNAGDTIHGELKNKNYYSGYRIKLFMDGDFTSYPKKNVHELHIDSERYINIGSSLFVKKVQDGFVNLYHYKRKALLGVYDNDIDFGRLKSSLRFYCSDYPNLPDTISGINRTNIDNFLKSYNSWKKKNPSSKSYFEKHIHTKNVVNLKLSFLLPGAGFEFGLNEKFSLNSMVKSEFGYGSQVGWILNPFVDTQLRYYYNISMRKKNNQRTYKYTGNYLCLVHGFFIDDEISLFGLEYGWQKTFGKNEYSSFGIGAGKWINYNSFTFLFDYEFGFNF